MTIPCHACIEACNKLPLLSSEDCNNLFSGICTRLLEDPIEKVDAQLLIWSSRRVTTEDKTSLCDVIDTDRDVTDGLGSS